MAITLAQRKQLLVDELSASQSESAFVRDRVDLYWEQYADRDQIAPLLTDQYVRRKLAQALAGPLRTEVDSVTADEQLRLHQQLDTLDAIISAASAEIVRLELKAARSRPGTARVMTPLSPAPVVPLRDERPRASSIFDERVVPTNPTMGGRTW